MVKVVEKTYNFFLKIVYFIPFVLEHCIRPLQPAQCMSMKIGTPYPRSNFHRAHLTGHSDISCTLRAQNKLPTSPRQNI